MEKPGIESWKILKAQENWRSNPLFCSKQFFNSTLWSKQQEVLLSVRDNQRTAVKSANTVGKSRVAAEICLIFLLSYYPSKVIITAPTFNQIEEILWKEISKLYNSSLIPIGGDLLTTELKLNEEWFALGISTDEVNRFQGFHSPYLLVIVDEALGVNSMIWEAIEGLHPYRILAIGNPLAPEGEFFKCFSNPLWHKITISGQECVDWQNKNGRIPGLITQEWIDERKDEWGEKSALYQARVTGEFPQEGTDVLIPMKFVDEARARELDEDEETIKIISGDIATKHGDNYTVILYRKGHIFKAIDLYQKIPATQSALNIQHKYENTSADTIVIDSDGFGEGVADILHQKKIGVIEFHGGYGAQAIDKIRFKNLRSQFYWIVAKKFEKGLYSLKDIPQKQFELLKNQLCSIKVKSPDGAGRFQIETKEDLLARGISSPDLADALVYSEYGYWVGKEGEIAPYRWR